MNQLEGENLSALKDGELGDEELRFLLRRTESNLELRLTWSRYHVLGHCLRKEPMLPAPDTLAAGVMAAIAAESGAVARRSRHHWLRWSAGGAIAAGVAVVALTMLQPATNDMPGVVSRSTAPASQVAHVAAVPAAPVHAPGSAEVPRWLSAAPPAARMAQAASADLYPGVQAGAESAQGYGADLAPYMRLPSYRAPHVRQARQALQQWWMVAPDPVASPRRAGEAGR